MTQELITTATNAQPAAAYLASLRTAVSRAVMQSELNKAARILGQADWRAVDWSTLSAPNVRAILSKVGGAPATRNKTLYALRGVAHMAEELHLIDTDTVRAIERIQRDRGSREPAGRVIEAWELHALMRACAQDATPAGARDGAMIALAAKTGARRAEVASINYEDITLKDDAAEVRVIGKGNKGRTLYLDGGALLALNDWLAVRGRDPGPLFFAIDKAGHLQPWHGLRGGVLSTKALHLMLAKRSTEAGVSNLSWHDFRRTVASALLDAGEDVVIVAGVLGHANVQTTAKYDRRPAEARRKAVKRISVPYVKRAG